jgi:glutathione synthase/RimK-type ligase-like ATP-grasp enzyme
LSRLQRFFPEDYNFSPASFLLPDEVNDLEDYMRNYPQSTFIAKPSKGRGGDGIFLVKKFSELPRSALTHDFIVQRYIDNPFLIDKKKFDLRIYVVIKSVDPI